MSQYRVYKEDGKTIIYEIVSELKNVYMVKIVYSDCADYLGARQCWQKSNCALDRQITEDELNEYKTGGL